MRLELQPISSVQDVAEWHGIVELLAIFAGSCAVDDLEWDDGELLNSFLEETDDIGLKADYRAEPMAGIEAAKDRFIAELSELIAERQLLLGRNSPFELGGNSSVLLIRRSAADTTSAGLAYAWLVIFWTITSAKDFLVIAQEDRSAFIRFFPAIFEYICSLVMAARAPSIVWHFGDSRDVREFLKRLAGVVTLAGNGSVMDFAALEANQTGANDAGVDVMAVTTRNGVIGRDSTAYLVGATIQKTDRRNKIIGVDQIRRFTAYFARGPMLAYHGVLAIPFPATPAEGLNCRDKNCAYITKEEILQNLALFPDDRERMEYVRTPRRMMLKKGRDWQSNVTLSSKIGELSLNWA